MTHEDIHELGQSLCCSVKKPVVSQNMTLQHCANDPVSVNVAMVELEITVNYTSRFNPKPVAHI